jgi:hypothetical protein
MRNAHMFLDQYLMIGEEDFKLVVRSAREQFLDFFASIAQKNKDRAFKAIDSLLTFPLADLKTDFQQTVLDIMKVLCGKMQPEARIAEVINLLGPDTLKLTRQSMADWVINSFDSDLTFQACMLSLFQLLSPISQVSTSSQNNPYARAMKT